MSELRSLYSSMKGPKCDLFVSFSLAEVRSPEFISDRLLRVTLELCGRARAATFVAIPHTAELAAQSADCRPGDGGATPNPGRSRAQHGGNREMSSLEAAEG